MCNGKFWPEWSKIAKFGIEPQTMHPISHSKFQVIISKALSFRANFLFFRRWLSSSGFSGSCSNLSNLFFWFQPASPSLCCHISDVILLCCIAEKTWKTCSIHKQNVNMASGPKKPHGELSPLCGYLQDITDIKHSVKGTPYFLATLQTSEKECRKLVCFAMDQRAFMVEASQTMLAVQITNYTMSPG